MSTIPHVNLGWLSPFLEILDEVGAPYTRILQQADLPTLAVDDSLALVPTANVYRFVQLAVEVTGISDLGLRAGARFVIESLVPAGDEMWRRPGVFRTIENFIQVALKSSSNVEMWIETRVDREQTVEFSYRGTFGLKHPAFPVVEQFMLALMVRLTRYAAGPSWSPTRVNLRARTVPEESIRRLVGGAQVRCGQPDTSIMFPGRRWVSQMQPFPEKSSVVWRRTQRSLIAKKSGDDLIGSLRLVLRAYLPDGSPDIGLAARLSGTSVRTLQRRLGEQGTTYSRLLMELRHDVAIYLLRNPDTQVSEVGRELGYRDPAIFTRAFRRWTGQTPSQFRRRVSV